MLDEYYTLNGWEINTSIPTAKKLKELGMKYLKNDLKKYNSPV